MKPFPDRLNPWFHLGALAFLFFVVCAATGCYLFAVFDSSVAGAYESGRALDRGVVGSAARGLHRYSADAFAVCTALHLVREAARGHFRAWRAWSWLSGLTLVPLAWVAGLTGFWLAWDERAAFSAAATAEWIAALPGGFAAFARDFTLEAGVSDRFFSLAVFVHIGVPLLALAATWAHLQRLSHVRAWPPAGLAVPAVTVLTALAIADPVASLGPARALALPERIAIDWFYLFPHALADVLSPQGLWMALLAASLALVLLPWLPGPAAPLPARVDLANCNGCARCVADCPFGAVVMVPRSDGRRHPREARVTPDLCAGCGICVGACPSATPFRLKAPLVSGIELPNATLAALRERLDERLAAKEERIVFACRGAREAAGPRAIAIECAAMLPPAFLEYALRSGAGKVVVASCRESDCEYRLGDEWLRARIARSRPPRLRASVARDRVQVLSEIPHV